MILLLFEQTARAVPYPYLMCSFMNLPNPLDRSVIGYDYDHH